MRKSRHNATVDLQKLDNPMHVGEVCILAFDMRVVDNPHVYEEKNWMIVIKMLFSRITPTPDHMRGKSLNLFDRKITP